MILEKKHLLIGCSLIVVAIALLLIRWLPVPGIYPRGMVIAENSGYLPLVIPTRKYDLAIDTFAWEERTVKNGESIGQILYENGINTPKIHDALGGDNPVLRPNTFRVGKKYTLFRSPDKKHLEYLVYEPDIYRYYRFQFIDSIGIREIVRPMEKRTRTASGVIASSIWNAMADQGASPELITKMEDALQWSIDFYHLQKGERFKLVYEAHFIEGNEVGAGRVAGARYDMANRTIHAIYYDEPAFKGYYDLEGRPLNKGFLKSPLRFSRISSHFNLSRLHPILRRVRPHLGTDYAAPYGTPIMAVGNGVVLEARYAGGNGNYVKIRHDKQHTTQYLHMSRFGPGIRSGIQVQQGQTIGYVGSTGLATGPHVCFRFWKNGKQVNHLRLTFPPPEPLPKSELPLFQKEKEAVLAYLNK